MKFIRLAILMLVLCSYNSPKESAKLRKTFEKVGCSLAKQHQLNFLNSGVGGLVDSKKVVWALNYTSGEKLTLEQARPLAVQMASALLGLLHNDPGYATYCKNTNLAFGDDLVGFRLAFWDENVDRPLAPYLAHVRFAEGKISYFYADPQTQALQEPIVESYQEAKAAVSSKNLPAERELGRP